MVRVVRILATAAIFYGCTVQGVWAIDLFGGRKKEGKETAQAALLRQQMMDFSDSYTLAIGQEIDEYIRGEDDPRKRLAGETWKTLFSAAAMGIAAGRDPASNLLDMYVFMRLSSDATRRYWVPEVFGKGAGGLNTANTKLLGELDETPRGISGPGQKEEVDAMIDAWRREHADMVYVAGIRLRDLAEVRSRRAGVKAGPIPVLSDMQKAVGEVDAAVEVAERVMFYLERLPSLVAMQTSLALAQAGAAPAVLSVSESAENASRALSSLPDALNESIAVNAEILKEILPQIRASLEATGKIMDTAERLSAPGPEGERWQKEEILLAIGGLESSAREVSTTLEKAERLLTRASEPGTAEATASIMREARDGSFDVVDHAYYRGVQLVLIFLAGQALVVWVVLRTRPIP